MKKEDRDKLRCKGTGQRNIYCYECGYDKCCPLEKLLSLSSSVMEKSYNFIEDALFAPVLADVFKWHLKVALFAMDEMLKQRKFWN